MDLQQNQFMKKAIELAYEGMSKNKGGPFGAVIVKEGKIIGEGYNQVTSTNDPTAHAEIVAIRNACQYLGTYQLNHCEIYTSCEPCPMCLGAIYWARINKVYYACTREDAAAINFDDDFIYDELKRDIHRREIEFFQVMRKNAMPVFQAWKRKTDRTEY